MTDKNEQQNAPKPPPAKPVGPCFIDPDLNKKYEICLSQQETSVIIKKCFILYQEKMNGNFTISL